MIFQNEIIVDCPLKEMKIAYATLKGFELMHMFRKKQSSVWTGFPANVQERVREEVRLINELFYVWTA